MENQLTTEQKARVFAQYLGCAVSIEYSRKWLPYQGRLCGIVKNETCIIDINTGHDTCAHNSRVRVYLRPLSDITDEDAIEVAKLIVPGNDLVTVVKRSGGSIYIELDSKHSIDSPFRMQLIVEPRMITPLGRYDYDQASVFQILIQRGYAVPLFIAPGHPLNGKTAIEMGLAIDATTL